MPTVFRITSRRHRPNDPSGALRTPGRWHDLNQAVLYFSSSLPLAVLELRVRGITYAEIRSAFHYVSLDLSDTGGIEVVPAIFFSEGWSTSVVESRKLGIRWYEKREKLCLQVRSAALHTESNYLVNVNHLDFSTLRFSPPKSIPLDERL
jgi:RES domain-containing protein